MIGRRYAVSIILLSVLFIGGKKDVAATDPVLTAITTRGRLMAEYDVASWHATDAVQAMNPPPGTIRRYIGRKNGSGWVVAFGRVSDSGDRFLVSYEATQGTTPEHFEVKHFDPPREDTEMYLSGARAIETALRDFKAEARPYNTYVLPSDANQLFVYILPAQTKAGIYSLGGDVRYLISSDGNAIVEKHPMHKSILEFDTAAASGKIVMGVHAHVLTDMPEDSDVFYVLTRKPSLPEIVVTGEHVMYLVLTDGKIERRKR